MKVDYKVVRKGTTGPQGQAIEEFGPGDPGEIKVRVYWGTMYGEKVIKVHQLRDLDIADK